MNWYYAEAGQQNGPFDDAGIDALVASGKITPETLVWREGMANWQYYRDARGGGLRVAGASPQEGGGGEAVCAECNGVFPINDTIQIGAARVCANCKPVFVQKMREGMEVGAAGDFRYAGFWIRFAASFLDGIILRVVNFGIGFALGLGVTTALAGRTRGTELTVANLAAAGFGILVAVSYETFMIGKYGATLGKMACKIQVVVPDGSKVSYGQALGRYFSKIVSGLLCLVGYIMAGFDDEKRALHDRMCNTRVIYK